MEEKHIQVQKTARYFTRLTGNRENIAYHWICCHGYAQTASSLLNDMKRFQSKDQLLIAPEGLSRFYRKGYYGEVVASWMTSEDRLAEIDDYCRYIQQVLDTEKKNIPSKSQAIGFGFSQGTATIIRWAVQNQPDINTFVLYAGLPPEDVNYDPDYWQDKQILFAYGHKDPFLTKGRLRWLRNFADTHQLHLREVPFRGKHKIRTKALREIDGIIRN